jgi:DNA-binding CsgD family transcriptional regulator
MPAFFPAPERARAYGLSDRELEVLCLTAEGLSSKEAGIRLGISESTVRGHLAKAAARLAARTAAQATARAVELGIIRT